MVRYGAIGRFSVRAQLISTLKSTQMKYLILLICLYSTALHAQPHSATTIQPTYSSLAYQQHIPALSFTANQASMARVTKTIAGMYAEQRYMLPELTGYAAAVVVPTHMGVFGGSAYYSGSATYQNIAMGVAYARSLGKTHVGIQFNYLSERIAGYKPSSIISADVALQYAVNKQLIVGVQVSQMGAVALSKSTSSFPLYRLGAGYQASEDCYVGVEMVRNGIQSTFMQSVIRYCFMEKFHAWAGYSSGNGTGLGGAGITKGNLRIDLNVSYHPFLGLSPGIGISKVHLP